MSVSAIVRRLPWKQLSRDYADVVLGNRLPLSHNGLRFLSSTSTPLNLTPASNHRAASTTSGLRQQAALKEKDEEIEQLKPLYVFASNSSLCIT